MEEKSNNKKYVIIICILAFLTIAFMCLFLFKESIFGEKKNNLSEVVETNTEKENDNNNENDLNEVPEVKNVKKLYEEIHDSEKHIINLNKTTIFDTIYKNDIFEVKQLADMKEILSFGKVIYEKIKNDVSSYVLGESGYEYLPEDKAKPYIEKAFKELFGDNLEFSNELFKGCNVLHYDEGKYYIHPQCGDISAIQVYFTLIGAEKDNNYLYLYENAMLVGPYVPVSSASNEPIIETKTYKWTFNKDSEGNYHILKFEKVSSAKWNIEANKYVYSNN